jgi:hypothetical protein
MDERDYRDIRREGIAMQDLRKSALSYGCTEAAIAYGWAAMRLWNESIEAQKRQLNIGQQ